MRLQRLYLPLVHRHPLLHHQGPSQDLPYTVVSLVSNLEHTLGPPVSTHPRFYPSCALYVLWIRNITHGVLTHPICWWSGHTVSTVETAENNPGILPCVHPAHWYPCLVPAHTCLFSWNPNGSSVSWIIKSHRETCISLVSRPQTECLLP